MLMPLVETNQQCPECGKFQGVESVHIQPLDERSGQTDRRKNAANATPYLRDRRQLQDRRKQDEWTSVHNDVSVPSMVCLACEHVWHNPAVD